MADNQYSFFGGFDSSEHLKRFILATASLAGVVTLSCYILFQVIGLSVKTAEIELRVNGLDTRGNIKKISLESTGLSLELEQGEKIATFLVPANEVWMDTKLDIPPNSLVRISASGSVTLSLSRAIDIANDPQEFDPRRYNNTVRPNGLGINEDSVSNRPADLIRAHLRIAPKSPVGALLATVQPDRQSLIANPKPKEIYSLDSGNLITTFTSKSGGRLFLTVNDLIGTADLNDKTYWVLARDEVGTLLNRGQQFEKIRDSYGQDANVREIAEKLSKRWDSMVSRNYFNIFIEDNGGGYMVSVSISSEDD